MASLCLLADGAACAVVVQYVLLATCLQCNFYSISIFVDPSIEMRSLRSRRKDRARAEHDGKI